VARGNTQRPRAGLPEDQPNGEGALGPDVIARLADDVLPTLVARLERSRLGEIEVRQDGWRVRLRRNLVASDGAEHTVATSARRAERKVDRPGADRSTDSTADGRLQPLHPIDRGAVEITSPGVGYFLPREGTAVGTSVRGGDVLGHVDVLGVRHDVVAPEDALLVALEAQSGQAVEYGQLLARLERRSGRPDTAIRVEAEVTA
jgi:biotin carboxyl carrier protein